MSRIQVPLSSLPGIQCYMADLSSTLRQACSLANWSVLGQARLLETSNSHSPRAGRLINTEQFFHMNLFALYLFPKLEHGNH